MRALLLLVLILVLTAGCATPRALYALKVHPKTFDWPIAALSDNPPASFVHEVQLVMEDRVISWVGVAEIKDDVLTLVALTPMGGRLFLIRYDGEHIQYIPNNLFRTPIKPERMLRDFFLIYAQPEWRATWVKNLNTETDDLQFRTQNREHIRIITTGGTTPWTQFIRFENPRVGYELVITPKK